MHVRLDNDGKFEEYYLLVKVVYLLVRVVYLFVWC